jgi:hypothetical protein
VLEEFSADNLTLTIRSRLHSRRKL